MYKKTFQFNKNTYDYLSCINMCIQIFLIKNCGCYDLGNGPTPVHNVRPCVNKSDQACDNTYSDLFVKKLMVSSCDCPLQCEKNMYVPTVSVQSYPSKPYAEYLSQDERFRARFATNHSQLTYEHIKERVASVNVFFNEISQTSIEERPKLNINDLIAGIFVTSMAL
jgi:hypothetical protein